MDQVVRKDARNRAWRTMVQGLVLDVIVALVLAAGVAIDDFEFTRPAAALLGMLLLKTAVHSAASYVARVYLPPPAGGQRAE
jgi:hypothetical protein